MKSALNFRNAKESDCSDLTILCDAATRGLTSYLWGGSSVVGECRFDVGRTMILTEKDKYVYFENWRIAECNGIVIGAFNMHRLPPVEEAGAVTSDVLRPLSELKAVAHGSQYISAIAIFPEFRRNGFAFLLLKEAERVAIESQDKRLTLMVGSFNAGAIQLYEKFGFSEWDRREFIPFENSDPGGDWLLMYKELR